MTIVPKDLVSADRPDHHYRLTTEQYYRMGEAGIFGDDKRIELIDGEIIKMAPIGPHHSRGGMRLLALLQAAVGKEYYVIHEEPITIDNGTEPQPDLGVAVGPETRYDDRHPTAGDLVVAIEISASSLAADRNRKLDLYASAQISECWIVNIAQRCVEVYSKPDGNAYTENVTYQVGETIRSVS